MPLFRCAKCGVVENTACVSSAWERISRGVDPECSQCADGKWHGLFPREQFDERKYRKEGWRLERVSERPMMKVMHGYNPPPDYPRTVPMDALNEEWAQRNHDQSLAELNQRGGLSPCEIAAIVERRPWHKMRDVDSIAVVKRLAVPTSPSPVKP